jgi:hypothetical protein
VPRKFRVPGVFSWDENTKSWKYCLAMFLKAF